MLRFLTVDASEISGSSIASTPSPRGPGVPPPIQGANSTNHEPEELHTAVVRGEEQAEQLVDVMGLEELKGQFDQQTIQSAANSAKRLGELKALELRDLVIKREEVTTLTHTLDELRQRVSAVQAKYRNAQALDDKRKSLIQDADNMLAFFSAAEMQQRLTSEALAYITILKDQRSELARVERTRLIERPDNDQTLADTEDTLSKLQQCKVQIDRIRRVANSLDKLGSIVGNNHIDSATSNKLANITSSTKVLNEAKVPLTTQLQLQLTEADETEKWMLIRIGDIIAHGNKFYDVEQHGVQYARNSGTSWTSSQKRNEMTDRLDITVRSIQKNEEGAVTEIEGKCVDTGVVVFTALVVDDEGKPTVGFPGSGQGTIAGTRRINSDAAAPAIFTSEQFSNKFDILVLVNNSEGSIQKNGEIQQVQKPDEVLKQLPKFMAAYKLAVTGPQPMDTTWRALVEFTSNKGDILIRIPLFEPNIRSLIASCKATP